MPDASPDPVDDAAKSLQTALKDVDRQVEKLVHMPPADPHRAHQEAKIDRLQEEVTIAEEELTTALDVEEAEFGSKP